MPERRELLRTRRAISMVALVTVLVGGVLWAGSGVEAARTLRLTPSTGLADGQAIEAAGTGLDPDPGQVVIVQCAEKGEHPDLAGCDNRKLVYTNGDGTFRVPDYAVSRIPGCETTCYIHVLSDPANAAAGTWTFGRVTFADGADADGAVALAAGGRGRPGGGGNPPPPPDGRFSCRASLLRVDGKLLIDSVDLEPIVANDVGDPCTTDVDALLNQQISISELGLSIGLKLLYTDTVNDVAQAATAEAGVVSLRIEVANLVVEVAILTAEAAAECEGGLSLRGESHVVGLRVNNLKVDVPKGPFTLPIKVLGIDIATLALNQTTTTADTVTQRALSLTTLVADIVVAEAIADTHGTPCGTTPKPPKTPRGWMTGGGSVGDTSVTHGTRLECVKTDGPNNLQVNWPGNGFHLETVTSAACSDAPGIDEGKPDANFDTLVGSGTGRCRNGGTGTATWTLTDAGEPGLNDRLTVAITGGCSHSAQGVLNGGNHQAHRRFS